MLLSWHSSFNTSNLPIWFKCLRSQFGIAPFPAISLTLEYFCAQASEHVSYKTLKVYLSSIRLAHIEQGLPDPTESTTLHLVCRGIRHQQGDHQRTRLPITINLLRTLKEQLQLSNYYTILEQRMLWAVFTVAFYGFFRVSELLKTLHWSDIALSTTKMSVTLHHSKTNPHFEEVKLFKYFKLVHPHVLCIKGILN